MNAETTTIPIQVAGDAATGRAWGTTACRTRYESNEVGFGELASYFSYGAGQCLSFGIMGTFVMFFYTDVLGISPIAASVIFVVARVWDAVNDPVMAGLMDSGRARREKFRPFMLYTPPLVAISTVACFVDLSAWEASQTVKVAYAALTYILWGMAYTASDVPFWSMSAVISRRPKERAKLVTAANLGLFLGIGIATLVVPLLSKWLGTDGQNSGLTKAVLLISVVSVLAMLLGYCNTRERVAPQADPVRLRDTVAALRVNKPMRLILAAFALNVFMNATMGLHIYFFTCNLLDSTLMSIYGVISIAGAVVFFAVPPLTTRFKKKQILIAVCVTDCVARVFFFTLGDGNVPLVMSMLTLTYMLYCFTGPLFSAMLADTIEYAEFHTGKRCTAITFSGQTFAGKLSVAIGGGLAGLVLAAIDYAPGQQAQSPSTLAGLFFCVALLPAVGSLGRIIILRKLDYTEDEHASICKALALRNGRSQASPGVCASEAVVATVGGA